MILFAAVFHSWVLKKRNRPCNIDHIVSLMLSFSLFHCMFLFVKLHITDTYYWYHFIKQFNVKWIFFAIFNKETKKTMQVLHFPLFFSRIILFLIVRHLSLACATKQFRPCFNFYGSLYWSFSILYYYTYFL